jgi:PEP-CTERM motif
MRRLVLSLIGASALAISSAASAVVILPGAPLVGDQTQGTTVFVTSPNPVPPGFVGPITATIGHTGIPGTLAGTTFIDQFLFRIGLEGMGAIGTGSGSVITSVNIDDFLGALDTDLTSVVFNNGTTDFGATLVLRDATGAPCSTRGVGTCGASESWALNNVPIFGGALDTLTVTGISRGNGSYGGNLTFSPTTSVPEPATWAMMLLGFAGIGWQFRRRRTATLPQFA